MTDPVGVTELEQAAPESARGRLRRYGIANLRRHTAAGMMVNSVFQIGLVAVSVLRGLIVAMFLTRSEYGLWGIISLTLWTALSLRTVFGANDKYVQERTEDEELAFQRAFTVELIFAAGSTPFAIGVVVISSLVTGHPSVLFPGLALLLLLPSVALQFPVATFFRRMEYRRQRLLQAVEPLVGAGVMIALAAAGDGYWSFVWGTVAGSSAGALVALRAARYPLRWRYDAATLRRYVGFSAPLLISAVAILGQFQVIYMVGVGPLGLAGLGAFTLVGNLLQFTDRADYIVTETLYPAVCAVSDRLSLLSEIFIKSNRLSLMWAIPFGAGMTLFGPDLLRFWLGHRWVAAGPLLQIMGVVTALNHVGYNWSAFVKSRGITWPIAASAAIVAAVVIGVSIPLMYSDHVIGLGYAFMIGAAVALLIRGVIVRRFFPGVRLLRHLLRSISPSIVSVMPVLALRTVYGTEHTVPSAIGMFLLYVVVTILATIALERPLLGEAVGYLMGRRAQLS